VAKSIKSLKELIKLEPGNQVFTYKQFSKENTKKPFSYEDECSNCGHNRKEHSINWANDVGVILEDSDIEYTNTQYNDDSLVIWTYCRADEFVGNKSQCKCKLFNYLPFEDLVASIRKKRKKNIDKQK
jgi:hypothetical protein